jgi:prepilin-type N-terminal cleavage/methylation domain-containing protein
MMMRERRTREGFTLIELMVTIVIVSILAMIGVSIFWRAKDRGLEASLQTDLRAAAVQQELYFESNQIYAANTASLSGFAPTPGVNIAFTYVATDGWAGIATHPSITGTRCGLLIGSAPAGSADPANATGIVMCTTQ